MTTMNFKCVAELYNVIDQNIGAIESLPMNETEWIAGLLKGIVMDMPSNPTTNFVKLINLFQVDVKPSGSNIRDMLNNHKASNKPTSIPMDKPRSDSPYVVIEATVKVKKDTKPVAQVIGKRLHDGAQVAAPAVKNATVVAGKAIGSVVKDFWKGLKNG
jgi:hypothetical protein